MQGSTLGEHSLHHGGPHAHLPGNLKNPHTLFPLPVDQGLCAGG
jgi:hypothetical protein